MTIFHLRLTWARLVCWYHWKFHRRLRYDDLNVLVAAIHPRKKK